MAYAKSFQAIITIYPDFEKDSYCNYFKEQLANWITDCFNSYIDFFNIKVTQAKGNAILYIFDAESGDTDLNFKKIWVKSPASYTIEINGSGIINYSVKNNLEPPQNITESILDKIYLKYEETSEIYPPQIIVYGKNPITRRTEVPIKYTFDGFDSEEWKNGMLEYDVYSEKWKIALTTSSVHFLDVLDILDELNNLNKNKLSKIYMDDFDNHIEMEGQFILKHEDKEKYLELLNQLSSYIIEDEFFEIEEINMNFIADSTYIFYFEKYFLDDSIAKFSVRHIEI